VKTHFAIGRGALVVALSRSTGDAGVIVAKTHDRATS
jgi:hypothetical protein